MKEGIKRSVLSRHIALILASFLLVMGMFALLIAQSNKAYAAVGPQNFNGITWEITDDGVLKLSKTPGTGGQEVQLPGRSKTEEDIESWADQTINNTGNIEARERTIAARKAAIASWPWHQYDEQITAVEVVDNIKIAGNMDHMFAGDPNNITSFTGLNKLDTSGVTAMQGVFGFLMPRRNNPDDPNEGHYIEPIGSKATTIDVSAWNTSNVVSFSGMFIGQQELTELKLSNFDTSNALTIDQMFRDSPKLTKIIGMDDWNVGKVIRFNSIFAQCPELSDIGDISDWNTSAAVKMSNVFENTGLETIDVSGWDTRNVNDIGLMFRYNENVKTIDMSGPNWDTSNVTKMSSLFNGCTNLTDIRGLENLKTDNVDSMNSMFRDCKAITDLDLSNWNTENVKDMQRILSGCDSLKTVDMTGWDTSNVTSMFCAFMNDGNLEEIKGLEGFDTSNVKNMQSTFYCCKALESDGMLGWDTSKAENMNYILQQCNALQAALEQKAADAEAAGDSEKAANYTAAAELVGQFKTAKKGDEALQLMDDAKAAFSAAVIEDAKAAAEEAIDKAANSEMKANLPGATKEDKEKAAADLKAAHAAADRVSRLAENTGKRADKTAAEGIQNDVADVENLADTRLGTALNEDITAAEALDTANKSAASVRALNDAIEAANEALTNGDAAAKSKALADLEKAVAGLTDKSNEEKAYDTAKAAADDAKAKADEAKAAYDAAKAKAEDEAAKNPGSDAAVAAAEAAKKAAEDYAAKAKDADDKAKAAAEAANKTTDSAIKKAANDDATAAGEEKKAADVANAEAAVANAEQLNKAVEKETDPVKKAELANKAVEAWKDAAGKIDAASESAGADKVADIKAKADVEAPKAEKVAQTTSDAALTTAIADAKKADTSNATPESKKALEDAIANAEKVLADPASTPEQKAAAAKAVAEAQKNLTNVDVKPGDQFVFNNQKYEVLTVPANGNGTAALVKGKNAKSVTVPKTASYTEKGKTFDVTEINTKAFYKKTRKVTVGANVDTIDKQAFKGSKVATVVLKTKDLTKKSVKGSLKGSKVKTVQVKVGSKKVNKKFVKKYKKIFTKKNAGKKVTVK